MSNVLPPEYIQQELARARARYVRTTGRLLLISAVVAFIALIPAYMSVRLARNALEQEVGITEDADTKAAQLEASRAQAIITALKPVAMATSSPSSALQAALSVKPAGISIKVITYGKGTLTLTAAGVNREVINDYRDALDAHPLFSSVVIPVAALVGAQEGKLTITLKGAF